MALTKISNRMISGAPVSVLDYGAKLDGIADDTAAWNAALETGRVILFPEGTSVITNRLNFPFIEGCRVIGSGRNTSRFVVNFATFNMSASAVIQMNAAFQGISSVCIRFSQPSTNVRANVKKYPPAININGHSRAELSTLRIESSWVGILGQGNCGGAVIDDIQIAAFFQGGVFDGAYDSIRINRFHFWPFGVSGDAGLMSVWGDGQTTCLDFGKVDDLNMSSVLTYQGRIIFTDHGLGGVFGVATDITLDADYGRMEFHAGDMSIASIYDSAAASDDFAIRVTGGQLRVSGLRLGGGNLGVYGAVHVEGGSFIASNIQFNTQSNSMRAFVQTGGRMLLSNGYFNEFSNAPRVEPLIHVMGGRAVLTGLMASDRPAGQSAHFIAINNDNWHVITGNSGPGWTYSFPATKTLGQYGPNAPHNGT